MAFLRDLGCDHLQGWLFSPAVPALDFAKMLRAGNHPGPRTLERRKGSSRQRRAL